MKMDIAAILISQYRAALEMLKQTIIECPESLWDAAGDRKRFWQVAYHALYFTHEQVAGKPRTNAHQADRAHGEHVALIKTIATIFSGGTSDGYTH